MPLRFGESLSNRGFSPCDHSWYQTLDLELEQQRVPLKFSDLINDLPLAIPRADDWPCVGHWTANRAAAREPLARLAAATKDADARESFATALQWLDRLATKPDCIVVGFHG